MAFNSFVFLVYFPLLFVLYYLIPANKNAFRNIFLLLSSYLIYLNYKPVYVFLLLWVTLITYFAAIRFDDIENKIREKRRKCECFLFVLLTLLPLFLFKYFNFINETVWHIMQSLGLRYELQGLNWAIPLGISFFSFQALGYMLDVYNSRVKSERSFTSYALFVSFFPTIVSGPINRAKDLLPQINQNRSNFDYDSAVEGLKLLLWGMVMKVVVADRIGIYVATVYGMWDTYSSLTCFVASIFYSIQIYADFGGYSLMAIGVGRVLGFKLMDNFNRPYFAKSITEFWRRWHISLTQWLTTHVYISLGGSHCTKSRQYLNIMLTFLVSGLWHGANWTFVVWGLIHGVLQVFEKVLGIDPKGKNADFMTKNSILVSVRILFTLFLVNLAWIFFRMPTFADALGIIKRIFSFGAVGPIFLPDVTMGVFIFIGLSLLLMKDFKDEFFPNRISFMHSKNQIVRWITYLVLVSILLLTGVFDSGQFIYANF